MTDLFALGERRLDWLTTRQSTIAENISNANTPGFRPRDLRAFSDVLDAQPVRLAATHPGHLASGAPDASGAHRVGPARSWETTYSGNSVALEQELMRASETNRGAAVATSVMRAFQRMTLLNLKG